MSMIHCSVCGYGVNIEDLTWKKVKDVSPDRLKKILDSESNFFKTFRNNADDCIAKDAENNREMSLIDFVQEYLDEQEVFYGILGSGVFDYATTETSRYIMLFPSFGWQRVDNFESEAEAKFYLWNILVPYLDMNKDDFCSKFDYIDDYYFG